MTHTKADTIARLKDVVFRHTVVINLMYRRFPPFPSERARYNFLHTRKRLLEEGMAHLGARLNEIDPNANAA